MYIANPNNPAPPGSDGSADGNGGNIIEILEPQSGNPSFRYMHSASEVWTGTKNSGGRMLAIPLDLLTCQPRTPFWEVLIGLLGVSVILCADGGQTESLSIDPRPIGAPAPTLDQLPKGIVPIPFHDMPGRPFQMLRVEPSAFADSRAQNLVHRVRSSGKFRWGMRGPGISAVVQSNGPPGVDALMLMGKNTRKPAEFSYAAGDAAGVRNLSIDLVGSAPGNNGRRFRLDQLALPSGRVLRATLANGGGELEIHGDREPL